MWKMDSSEFRAFVPAKKDVADLAELAGLEKVSVLTYNVLSQMGTRRMQRGKTYASAAILNINYRREKLLRFEVDEYDDWWAAELAIAGYDSIYATSAAPGSTPKENEIDEGLVTAFRKSTFQLFRSSEVHLNDLCANINAANLAARAKQDKLALLVCLHLNTQLASGITPEMETVRVLQTEYLCRQLAVFNADFQLPIVLAGTFNATPSSDVYHTIITGRRRPVPEAPAAPGRPMIDDPTSSSLRISWEPPKPSLTSLTPSVPILEYKIAVRNCSRKTSGFQYELPVPEGSVNSFIVTSLSADMTYQFRVMARNKHGWGFWSQPSTPGTTLEHTNASTKRFSDEKAVFLAPDVPSDVKPYEVSFGSGYTPRYASDSKKPIVNALVCPRPLLASATSTLQRRADRDSLLVHNEMMESAYGSYAEYMSEPELTFSSDKFQGTIDYIFHSAGQLTPFQLLQLPTLDELQATGQDARVPVSIQDIEWAKHNSGCAAPILPNVAGRASEWLPNAQCPSDHLPLACVFAIKKQNLAVMWN
eukprot:jgi/Phyca11/524891/estExt2_fgenesh1_pm.C_PHYCAscaffold_10087